MEYQLEMNLRVSRFILLLVGMASIVSGGTRYSQSSPDDIDVGVRTIQSRLSPAFRTHETNHFIILSDAGADTMRQLAGTLERTYHQFDRACRRLKLKTKPLVRKFPCVLFRQRDDFRVFARKYDRVSAEWVGGYYANADNYMVFYSAGDDPGVAEANAQFDKWTRDLNEVNDEIHEARSSHQTERAQQLKEYASKLDQHIKKERRRFTDSIRTESVARTIHETVHLLAFNSGIQSRLRVSPFWLSEGLATNFEVDDFRFAFGPDFENAARREKFTKYLNEEKLIPLRSFVTTSDTSTLNGERADILYQQTYAFFRWLYRFHRDELARFIHRYAQPPGEDGALPSGDLTTADHIKVFESIFGQVESIEKKWLRWESSTKR